MPSVDKILIQTLTEVVRFLELNQVSYALIGGLAASIRGRTRTTEDVARGAAPGSDLVFGFQ